MIRLCLGLIPLAFLIAWPLTAAMVRLGIRFRTFDSEGVPGQEKAPRRQVPNTGGVAIFWAIVAPIGLGLWRLGRVDPAPNAEWREEPVLIPADLHEHIAGIHDSIPAALGLVACLFGLHLLGLADDRRPMGPRFKLLVMAIPAVAFPFFSEKTRLLTMLDVHVGGPWLSIAITAIWILAITNAMNFMDNMDGLSGGVGMIAGALFLAAALANEQWFVGACLALLVGACAGFLVFNFPWRGPARIFMGDGGSLVIGFLLAFLTVRTTYYRPDAAGGWYAVLMPAIVLAVPLYDMLSVILIRRRRGKPIFVGDTRHLSHRLVERGLSRRNAVLVIAALTAATGIGGVSLASLAPWQAALVGVQTLAIIAVVAILEKPALSARE